MRCKNCGSENDDNRYICQNCGSPLYDEQDFDDTVASPTPAPVTDESTPDLGMHFEADGNNSREVNDTKNKDAEKKSIIVIAILAVILVAIIASIIVVAQTKSKNEEKTSKTSISTTESTSDLQNSNTRSTTTTTTERTTTTTTTTTAKPTTTTTTTQAASYRIKLISEGGGTVSGSGSYNDGDNVTITATADSDYEFDGWYSDGTKISSAQSYSFTATKDMTISARFNAVTTQAPTENEGEIIDGGWE